MTASRRKKKNQKKNQLEIVHKAEAEVEAEADVNVRDRISELGDDILLSIISRLTWKEATATRLLSTRWGPLHTRIPRLNFPPLVVGKDFKYEEAEEVKNKHIEMINRTLDSYTGDQMLKELTIDAHCVKGANVMRWLDFALAREVEVIDIRLSPFTKDDRGYYIQLEKLIRTKSCQTLPGLKCLRELSLSTIGVYDEDFTLLLSNSPNLERLSLENPRRLRNISIVGHPKLQHFKISSSNIEFFEITDVINLVSLSWYGLPHKFPVRVHNVPNLNEFNSNSLHCLFELPPYVLSQLQLVRLTLGTYISGLNLGRLLPELINVKRLEVQLYSPQFVVIKVIEACRSLEEFEMKIMHSSAKEQFVFGGFHDYRDLRECSPILKKVKLSRYLGTRIEWEFAAFIIKYAAAPLQEIVIQLYDKSKTYRQLATNRVKKQLKPIIPNSVNLVVI